MKLLKKLFLPFCLSALLLVCSHSSAVSAQKTAFLTSDEPTFLYIDTMQLNFNHDNEKL